MISSFKGAFSFLSNFYPCHIRFEGRDYPSVEHAYQAAKTQDDDQRATIAIASTAGVAKQLGKKVTLRPGWEGLKLAVMREFLEQKFASGTELCRLLRDTGKAELVEGNWWGDTYWGVCEGRGENHLGRLLMDIRDKRNAG
jgi:ribA/ribD-fused uncharacterized protein